MPYLKVAIYLPDRHIEKIKDAVKAGAGVKLRLGAEHLDHTSENALPLTRIQYERLQTGGLHDVTIPHNRIVKYGGFLPFLLPILGGLGALAGISGGIATTVAKAKEAQLAHARRAAVGHGLRRKRRSKIGSCVGNPIAYY